MNLFNRYIVPKGELKQNTNAESTCSNNDKKSETIASNNNEKSESVDVEPIAKKPRLSNREYKKLKKGQNKVSFLHRYISLRKLN